MAEKTNKVATYVLSGFGGVAVLCLILWFAGVLKSPGKDAPTGAESPLGGSASEVIYGK